MNKTKNNRYRIVVDSIKDCASPFHDLPLVEAQEYLSSAYGDTKSIKVLNLCAHRRRLSAGYYVSLLAEARKHRCLPEASTLHQLSRNVLARDAINELQALIDKSFERLHSTHFTLSVYLGENLAQTHGALSKKLYSLFPAPLARYEFKRSKHWKLHSVSHLGLQDVPEDHIEFVRNRLENATCRPLKTRPSHSKTYKYDLAILTNPQEETCPSDEGALKRFVKAAERLDIRAEIIGARDFPRLMEFDALFIRETTRLDNHTYRFSNKAARSGMPVIDDPESILRCCNKVYLNELLRANHIATPKGALLTKRSYEAASQNFNYPIILKIPDGSFSIGVHKASTQEEFIHLCRELFTTSSILLAQEYLPTDYDWRIGVLNGKLLFACRYFMSKGHWQIYNHSAKGDDKIGDTSCVPLEETPKVVLDAALKATALIGHGLYGVDIKENGGKAYVIEVNDNPNIDAGIEDGLIGDKLYLQVMQTFLDRLDAIHAIP